MSKLKELVVEAALSLQGNDSNEKDFVANIKPWIEMDVKDE